jgi:uncharacterized protein YjbI with pentapeptide repeats
MNLNFSGQDLRKRSFKGQNLTGANFSDANLQNANFSNAILIEADFSNANLRGAKFVQAQLYRSNFSQAIAGLPWTWKLIWKSCFMLGAWLSGLGAGLGGSWITNLLFASNSLFQTGVEGNAKLYSLMAGLLAVTVLAISLIAISHRGLGYALRVGSGAAIGLGLLITTITARLEGVGNAAGEISVSVGGTAASAVFLGMVSTLLLALSTTVLESIPISGVMAAIGVVVALRIGTLSHVSPALLVGTFLVGCIVLPLGLYIGKQALNRRVEYQDIHLLAKVILTLCGTQFKAANLTEANFFRAFLKHTDFSHAIDYRTCWYEAQRLHWARVNSTLLMNDAVCSLLVTGKGVAQSYAGMNLRGANLVATDLSHANLKGADLSHATLRRGHLEWANLAEAQLISTDLTGAHMTGVCGLNTWNIDETTQLEAVDCRWIYLLENPKNNTDDRERRPSSGDFAPGEFTSLFQELIDTVDLIFRNGINWKAFNQSFQQVQSESQTTPLEIQSIENKGNGMVVVRVKTSPEVSKEKLHSQFMIHYQSAIALNGQQQAILNAHTEEIQYMRSVINRLVEQPRTDPVAILNLGKGDFQIGFSATLQIWQEGVALPSVQITGDLPPSPHLWQSYQQWQSAYRKSLNAARIDVPPQVTNVSPHEVFNDCLEVSRQFSQQFQEWLNAESFRAIEQAMQIHFSPHQPIRIILQTDEVNLRHLPWHTWQFFENYLQAELALSKSTYCQPPSAIVPEMATHNPQVKILAVLGDSGGIDLEKDQAALKTLEAEVTFLITPQRQDLSENLWEQQWDILFFAGHSRSNVDGKSGTLAINETEHLKIDDIRYALTKAIARGLKLAIFNSCDGLGLAVALADLQLPQIIVMRQPVPDVVAQAFLMSFLKSFSSGQSLYQSVREARERLQDLENLYPCASWLPVLVQNLSVIPPTWQALKES